MNQESDVGVMVVNSIKTSTQCERSVAKKNSLLDNSRIKNKACLYSTEVASSVHFCYFQQKKKKKKKVNWVGEEKHLGEQNSKLQNCTFAQDHPPQQLLKHYC